LDEASGIAGGCEHGSGMSGIQWGDGDPSRSEEFGSFAESAGQTGLGASYRGVTGWSSAALLALAGPDHKGRAAVEAIGWTSGAKGFAKDEEDLPAQQHAAVREVGEVLGVLVGGCLQRRMRKPWSRGVQLGDLGAQVEALRADQELDGCGQ
jgi:hypothetical protein